MDRDRLSDLLKHPSHTAKQDVSDLRDMVERYPWFSAAQLLLAVGQHGSGDVLANSRQTPAAQLPSRAVLYDLVHTEKARQSPGTETGQTPEKTTGPDAPTPLGAKAGPLQSTLPAAPSSPEILPAVPEVHAPPPAAVSTAAEMASFKAEAPETTIVPAEQPTHPEGTGTLVPPAAQEAGILDQQMREAIHASGYDLGKYAAPQPGPAKEPPPRSILPPTPAQQLATAPPQEATAPEVPREQPVPVPIPQGGRLTFTNWLSRSASPEEAVAGIPAEITSATPVPEVPLQQVPTIAKAPLLSTAELMDQFIRQSAPAAKSKAAFFKPQAVAKKSLEDHGMVSETLARILEQQGNFDKAKEVYERLAWKHPEKSVYFAALSKALEGRLNK